MALTICHSLLPAHFLPQLAFTWMKNDILDRLDMTCPHTPDYLGRAEKTNPGLRPTSGAVEQGNRGTREEKGGKYDHNEAFKLLRLDTMQETLLVTLRNLSRSFFFFFFSQRASVPHSNERAY